VWNSLILFETSLLAYWLTRYIENQITVKRTRLNNPLEVQLHITEAVCPSLSEPGYQSLSMKVSHCFCYFSFVRRKGLSSITGVSVCLNKGDVDPKAQQVHLLIIVLHD
jgi:hypothetical protein